MKYKNDFASVETFLQRLREAVQCRDKKQILYLYDQAAFWDFEQLPYCVGDEYDQLVDQANDILYS